MPAKLDPVLASELRTKLRIARQLMQEVQDDLTFKIVGQKRLPREHTQELSQRLESLIPPLAGISDEVGRLAFASRRRG